MKLKAAAVAFMFLLMAILPFAASKCRNNTTAKTAVEGIATPDTADNRTDVLCALTAAKYREGYGIETVKAIALILNTNYKLKPESFGKNDFLYKEDASGNISEVYSDIEGAVNSVKEKTLCKDGKAFYIPFSQSSNGKTSASRDYTYLEAVASPWDCFEEGCDEGDVCVGVSLTGVNYLCSNGESFENALLWYLPGFSIN